MGELYKLSNQIQNYAWGSRTVLAQMRGMPVPSDLPEAEVWVGAHPSAPSVAHTPAGERSLDSWVEQNPAELLPEGKTEFPYLFKILAIDAPLSIQVHPTDEQALTGFDAEEAAGVPLDAPHRNYKDRFSKPETVIALTDVTILTGVRPHTELKELAEALGLTWLTDLLQSEEQSARDLLTAIIRLDDDTAATALATTVNNAAAWLQTADTTHSLVHDAAGLIDLVNQKHPDDRGLLVAVVMNLLHLKPGDSAFTPDGQVHAYVSGTAVEIMNPSDNVMRAGLTPKHIDVDELIKILREEQKAPEIHRAEPDDGALGVFKLWDDRLSVTRVRVKDEPVQLSLRGTATVLGVEGKLTFTSENETFEVAPTESLLHAGQETSVTMTGDGEAYIASYV